MQVQLGAFRCKPFGLSGIGPSLSSSIIISSAVVGSRLQFLGSGGLPPLSESSSSSEESNGMGLARLTLPRSFLPSDQVWAGRLDGSDDRLGTALEVRTLIWFSCSSRDSMVPRCFVRPLQCSAQNASRGIVPVVLISWVTSLTPDAHENT